MCNRTCRPSFPVPLLQVRPSVVMPTFPVPASRRRLSRFSVATLVAAYVSSARDRVVAKSNLRARAQQLAPKGRAEISENGEHERSLQLPVTPIVSSSISVVGTRWTPATLARPFYHTSSSSQRRRRNAGIYSTATSGLTRRHVHIGHSTDVHRWRNPEKEEVRRQFRNGVKLGSHIAKVREQQAKEKELIEQDKFTDWRLVYNYAIGAALLLIGLNLMLAFVEPNPSPEYVPYTKSVAPASPVSDTMADASQLPLSEAGGARDVFENAASTEEQAKRNRLCEARPGERSDGVRDRTRAERSSADLATKR
ncbi:hypothetical protein, conserved [Leishmania tarentolae]|uniref:Transmembrane protein n=1 Tax=Leishmania tarentolae TaxID=5689 RepID=A0A640KMZ6_LEITA|nr:hypothetical protein, conserved [Leishmania tarentolae]